MKAATDALLPIEVVPGTSPPKFRWRQVVETIQGKNVVRHEGTLPATVERAVESLVGIATQLLAENGHLKGRVLALEKEAGAVAATPPAPAHGKKAK